jgi:lipopolysaccharide export system permease protein
MRIVHRYLIREVLLHFITVTGVLFVILVSSQLAKALTEAASNQFPLHVVMSFLGLMSLRYLPELVPLGLFLGTILALGRLYHDSEVSALQSCGVGVRQLAVPVMVVAGSAAVVLALLSLWVAPLAVGRIQEIRLQALRDARLANLASQRFKAIGDETVYYAESVDRAGILHNVFVQRRIGEKVEITVAPRAEQRGAGSEQQTFVLYDGEHYEGIPGAGDFSVARFGELDFPVRLPGLDQRVQRIDAKSTLELWSIAQPAERAEVHARLAAPIMVLALALLAVPLSRLRPRQGRYANIGIALLACFLYLMSARLGATWIEQGTIPLASGLWWLHAIVFAIGLGLLFKQDPLKKAVGGRL